MREALSHKQLALERELEAVKQEMRKLDKGLDLRGVEHMEVTL